MSKKSRRDHPKSPTKCAFCGADGLTNEHLWPDWLEPYIPRRLFARSMHTTSRFALLLPDGDLVHHQQKGQLHRAGDAHSQRLRIVCGRCNNRWMSLLQNQVKPTLIPLIRGEWPTLSPWDRRVLAAWATMFTMVIEFADPNTLVTPFAQRDEFRRVKAPPKDWIIWFGLFDGVMWRGVFNHFGWAGPKIALEMPSTSDALTAELDTQSTAFVLGRVFFQTFSTTRPGLEMEELAFADRFGIRCLWPDGNGPIVRPDHVLDDVAADNISSALQPFPRALVRRAWDTI